MEIVSYSLTGRNRGEINLPDCHSASGRTVERQAGHQVRRRHGAPGVGGSEYPGALLEYISLFNYKNLKFIVQLEFNPLPKQIFTSPTFVYQLRGHGGALPGNYNLNNFIPTGGGGNYPSLF